MSGRERLLNRLLELHGRSGPRSRPELLHTALGLALELADAAGVVLVLGGTSTFERHALQSEGETCERFTLPWTPTPFEWSILRSRQPRVFNEADVSTCPGEKGCPGVTPGPALYLPLQMGAREHGYLSVHRHADGTRFTGREARTLALFAAWLTSALDNLRLAGNLERLAVTDDLTQVYNYRYLKSALRREIKRAARFQQPMSILMLDVDNLKAYNDRNGHVRGSMLLREMAQLFAKHVRSWDLVAKYGGDEFTVILPQTDRAGALAVAERLRATVAAHTFPLATKGQITVSTGIAQFPEDGTDVVSLIETADRTLYSAKKKGRNRVEGGDREAA